MSCQARDTTLLAAPRHEQGAPQMQADCREHAELEAADDRDAEASKAVARGIC
jgi:hypothetical protein